MSQAARSALDALDGLLAAATARALDRDECLRCVALAEQTPGRRREVARALAAQRDAAAVDALLVLPAQVPGVIEGLYGALARGVRRSGPEGRPFPAHCALDFRVSRAHGFAALLERARLAFGPGCQRLRLEGRPAWRVSLRLDEPLVRHGSPRVDAPACRPGWAQDLAFLQRRLSRLRGTRLWLNGWCFPQDGPVTAPAQAHLLAAWTTWAEGRR